MKGTNRGLITAAVMAVAATLGYKESVADTQQQKFEMPHGVFRARRRSGSRRSGSANPPGSKLLRRAFKAKIGVRGTYEEAKKWYAERPA